jgi:hypothetical protein
MKLLLLILILRGYAMKFLLSMILLFFTIRCGRRILDHTTTAPLRDLGMSMCLAFVLLVIIQLVILL